MNENAKNRFEYAKFNRRPIPERGFAFSDRRISVVGDLERRGWENFGKQPGAAVVTVVREFYANAAERTDSKAVVRGCLVSFDSVTINELLGVEVVDNSEFEGLMANPDYSTIIDELCFPGAEWKPPAKPSFFLEKFLKLRAAIWYAFLSKRLMPVSHTSDVQKERAVGLFALLRGIPINVGKLIFTQIMMSIHHVQIGLFFPTVISDLCARAGVVFRDDDEWLPPMRAIDESYMKTKDDKRKADFPPRAMDVGGSSTFAPPPRPPQPRRRTLNDKVDELGAFAIYQNQQDSIMGAHFQYVEQMMQGMSMQMGVDPSVYPPPPAFLPPFQFQYSYPAPEDAEAGVPPPEFDEAPNF